VVVVVRTKEVLAECDRIFDRAKRSGNVGWYLNVLKWRFGEGVVVADVRAAVRFADAQCVQECGGRFGGHRRPSVGVQDHLARNDAFLAHRFGDEVAAEFRVLRDPRARRSFPDHTHQPRARCVPCLRSKAAPLPLGRNVRISSAEPLLGFLGRRSVGETESIGHASFPDPCTHGSGESRYRLTLTHCGESTMTPSSVLCLRKFDGSARPGV